jgi:hypothetical protein
MCSKGGGTPPVPSAASTTFNSTTQPAASVSPLYTDFLNRANTLSNTPFNAAQLGTVAPMNAQQTAAGNQMFAQGMDMGNFDAAKVRAIQSPYIQDVVGSTQNWFNNQNAIQGNDLLSQAIKSGNAFGGDRAGVAEGVLAGQQQLAQAPVIAGLYQSGYTQALDEYNKLKQFGIQGSWARRSVLVRLRSAWARLRSTPPMLAALALPRARSVVGLLHRAGRAVGWCRCSCATTAASLPD